MKRFIAAILLLVPVSFPVTTLAWTALTYQEAVILCDRGYLDACRVVQAYHARQYQPQYRSSPADAWVDSEELQHGGLDGVRPGPFSTYDFIK